MISTEIHSAEGVGGCRFFVASVSDGPRILDTFESSIFEPGSLELIWGPVSRTEAYREAAEWCAAQKRRRT